MIKLSKHALRAGAKIAKMSELNETKSPLTYKVLHKCEVSNARVGLMSLLHHDVDTPVFMPVGTQVNLLIKRVCLYTYMKI